MAEVLKNVDGETVPTKKALDPKKLAKQEQKLEELKGRVQDIMKPHYDDFFLHKWLKARQYDVNKAEQMLRESVIYKENMRVDTLLQTYNPPEVLKTYLTGGFPGFDKEGSPIRLELFGKLDIKGLMYSSRRTDLERAKLFQCETAFRIWTEQSKKLGKRVDGQTVIFDMNGVGMDMLWQPGLKMYLHLVKVMEDNYPEMLKRMFVINAPRIFPLLYKICRPLISEDMKDKIHVLGSDYMDTMVQYMDADQIPEFIGGTLTGPDGDPLCLNIMSHGGKVPESFYLKDHDLTGNMISTTVARGEKMLIQCHIDRPGTILRWEYTTEGYDIGFAVWLTRADGTLVEIVPDCRTNSHIMTEDGSRIVEEAGQYTLCFDNSFSWTRAKKIKYLIELLINELDEGMKPDFEKMMDPKELNGLSDTLENTHM